MQKKLGTVNNWGRKQMATLCTYLLLDPVKAVWNQPTCSLPNISFHPRTFLGQPVTCEATPMGSLLWALPCHYCFWDWLVPCPTLHNFWWLNHSCSVVPRLGKPFFLSLNEMVHIRSLAKHNTRPSLTVGLLVWFRNCLFLVYLRLAHLQCQKFYKGLWEND